MATLERSARTIMQKQNDERIFDQRLLEKNLRKGTLNEKDFEKHLKSLPDEAGNADYFEIIEEPKEEKKGTTEEKELTFSIPEDED